MSKMKNMHSYIYTGDLLKWGFCGLLMLGSVSVSAQEDNTDGVEQAAKPAKEKKEAKSYPTTPVKGTIYDAATGAPVAGARISAYNDNRYTAMTGEDGTYTIEVPKFVTSLYVQLDGYNAVQRGINGQSTGVNAYLYTTEFREDYAKTTTGIKSEKTDRLDYVGEMSIDHEIQKQLGADVRALTRSGAPGMGTNMYMYGLNSLNINAQPLVVIDGVIMDMQYDRSLQHDGAYNNILANINPDDIASIEVMKNGTAIYGAKASNGVILITTKRNRSMATKIDVNIFGGYELQPKSVPVMNASQYRNYASELLGTADVKATASAQFLVDDKSYYYYNQYHNDTDWSDQVYQDAFVQHYGINVQGGDEVANYNLSVGYAQADATLKQNNYDRFNLRLNSDISLIGNLSMRFDASYSDVNRDLRDDGVIASFENATPTAPGFLSSIKSPFLSPYAYTSSGELSSFLADADNYLSSLLSSSENVSLANPASILYYGEAKNKNAFSNRLINLAITPKYQFNKHLYASEHFSFGLNNTSEQYYLPYTGVPTVSTETLGDIRSKTMSLAARQNSFYSDTKVDWNNKYSAHNIHVMGGFRYISNTYKLTEMEGYNNTNDKTPNMSTSLAQKSLDGADDSYKSITWYAQANYNFAEKYYVDFGISMDANSRYGKDGGDFRMGGVAWGLFPSVQGAWVVSNEKWFNLPKVVDYLKINAGFDITGNDGIDNTASKTYWTSHGMIIANGIINATGLALENIGNNEFQWETTKRFTAGVQTSLFNNRLSLQANIFKSWTSNLVTLKTLSYLSGIRQTWSNDGKLENKGFDVRFDAKIINTKDWKWNVGASLAHYKNEVTALPNDNAAFNTTLYGGTVRTQVGSPVGIFYGYQTNGVYATSEEAAADGLYIVDSETSQKSFFAAGDVRFVDQNGDKVIDEKDMVQIGDPNPDAYGNIFTSASWKRLTLDVVFNYSIGNDIYNYNRSVLEGGSRFFNQSTALLNRWTTEGQVTDIPRITYGDPMGNSRFSDRWIEDGSYLRLKSVTLSYTQPVNWLFLQGFTVWAQANNLFTITKYLGNDPEVSLSGSVLSQGIDRGLLSQGRSFVLGIKLNL
jgi:TonB-linked SusC/RagA family outer membrane protein